MSRIKTDISQISGFEQHVDNYRHRGMPYQNLNELPSSLKYTKASDAAFNFGHIGQRKLLLSELDFMSNNKEPCRILYVGASPCMHLQLLLDLYPNAQFITVDPNELMIHIRKDMTHYFDPTKVLNFKIGETRRYDSKIKKTFNVYSSKTGNTAVVDESVIKQVNATNNLTNENIRESIAQKIAEGEYRVNHFGALFDGYIEDIIKKVQQNDSNKPLYLWSDIRKDSEDNSKSNKDQKFYTFETGVIGDLARQLNWVISLKPAKSMLKFRTPFFNYDNDKAKIIHHMYNNEYDDEFEKLKNNGYDIREELIAKNGRFSIIRGEIHLQTRNPAHSTETRYIIHQSDIGQKMPINSEEYDSKLFYHNSIVRSYGYFDNGYCGCHCQDCALDYQIIKNTGEDPMEMTKKIHHFSGVRQNIAMNHFTTVIKRNTLQDYYNILKKYKTIYKQFYLGYDRNAWQYANKVRRKPILLPGIDCQPSFVKKSEHRNRPSNRRSNNNPYSKAPW